MKYDLGVSTQYKFFFNAMLLFLDLELIFFIQPEIVLDCFMF